MLDLLKKLWERKVTRFLLVGCFNTTFDLTLLLTFVKVFGWPPLAANSLSVTIAVTASYFLNHSIVFRDKSSYSLQKYVRFFLVTGLGVILIQDVVIYLVTDRIWVISDSRLFLVLGHHFHLKTAELIGAKLSAVLVGLAWNYFLYKYVVFGDSEDKEEKLIVG